jgi:hypothetical protein
LYAQFVIFVCRLGIRTVNGVVTVVCGSVKTRIHDEVETGGNAVILFRR